MILSRPCGSLLARHLSSFLTVLLFAAALLPVGPVRMYLFGALPGLVLALGFRRRWRLLEFPAVGVALSLPLWAIAAPILYKIDPFWSTWWTPILAFVLTVYEWPRKRRIYFRATKFDAAAAALMIVMAIPIALVFFANGLRTIDGEIVYLARDWFRDDSFYFFALTQAAIEGGGLPDHNPFLAGTPNCYPSLIHGAFGQLTIQGGGPAAVAVHRLSVMYLLANIGLLVLAPVRRAGVKAHGWRALAVFVGALSVALLRPDLFVYPNTNAFAWSFVLLIFWFLGPKPSRTPMSSLLFALALSAALAFSHAMTFMAALVLLACDSTSCLLSRSARKRGLSLVFCLVALAMIFGFVNSTPYPNELSLRPASLDWATVLLFDGSHWAIPLMAICAVAVGCRRRTALALPGMALAILSGLYFVFGLFQAAPSDQWFIQFNAGRFVHFGLLAALPGCLMFRRKISLAIGAALLLGAVASPTFFARRTPRLVQSDPLVLSSDTMDAFERIRLETPPDARFITNRDDYALAAFTGRGQPPCNEDNVWGRNAMTEADFDAFREDVARFWREASSPEQRLAIMRRYGLTHALVMNSLEEHAKGLFPPGSIKTVVDEVDLVVLERIATVLVPRFGNRFAQTAESPLR